jgi:phosphomannomutase
MRLSLLNQNSNLYLLHTASHLPYNRNGFKFFTNAGGLGKADIKDILERAADIYNNFPENGLMNSKEKASTSIRRVDYMTIYTSDLVKAVRKAAGNIGIISRKYFIEVEMFEIKIPFSHYAKFIIDGTDYHYSVLNIP